MHAVDRLLQFLTVTGLWLVAAMLYVAFFHDGGMMRRDDAKPATVAAPPAPPAPPAPAPQVTVSFPASMAVVNAEGTPLRIVGEVSVPQLAKPAPPPRFKIVCRFAGNITTSQPSLRLFSGDWKPDREWPVAARIECETLEPTP